MRRYDIIMAVLAMLFVLNPTNGYGRDIVNLRHIVQRGETIETLADSYRLTTDMLKAVNLGMDTFYTGMEVFVPVDKKYMWLRTEEDSEDILKDIAGYFSEYQEASRIFNTGNYRKADKLFESTIRNHGKLLPCEEAYFGKAMCDYNRKKWSSAVDGFEKVISIDDCPEGLREQSRSLKSRVEEQREARNQRTADFFSGLFQAAAEVGTAYMAASQANAGQNCNYPSLPQGKNLGNMSDAEFTNYVNTSLSQLANYSMMQVEQQWKQEEIQVKTGFASTYRQLHGGKEPSAEEIQAAYNNYVQTKVNTYKTVQQASSGMYDKELGISGSSSSASRSYGGYKCKKLSATDKAHCNDTGVCQNCNSRKVTLDILGNTVECTVCYGKGVCPSCQGRL